MIIMLVVFAVLLSLLSVSRPSIVPQTSAGVEYAIVNTTYGAVRGQAVNSNGDKFIIFEGIPYAKPPVGDLRFKAPVAHDRWSGVKDAFQTGSVCVQTVNNKQYGTEDCLFLNVFTQELPKHGTALKPVMVDIHGGGFTHGSGKTSPYAMVAEGIVFVSFNYRLSVLGFLNLNSPEVSSNNGLKDQNLALRWVHDNIAKFGGDPSQVTIFGQSAGGASIEFQILSPLSKGLFHRAISDSGSALDPWAFQNSTVDQAFVVAKKMHHTSSSVTDLVKFFKSVSAKELEANVAGYSFVPTLEFAHQEGSEVFLPEEPIQLLKQGRYQLVPYISGINSKEQKEDSYVINIYKNPAEWKKIDLQRFIPEDLHLTKGSKLSEEVAAKMKQFYLGSGTPTNAQISSLVDMDSDHRFVIGVHRSIKQRVAHGNPHLYLYQFSFDGKLNQSNISGYHYPVIGAAHGDEESYLFYTHPKKGTGQLSANSTEVQVAHRMTKMWSNFVKYGNPTQGMQPTWLPTSKVSPAHLEIGAESRLVKEDLAASRMAFWDKIYASLGKI